MPTWVQQWSKSELYDQDPEKRKRKQTQSSNSLCDCVVIKTRSKNRWVNFVQVVQGRPAHLVADDGNWSRSCFPIWCTRSTSLDLLLESLWPIHGPIITIIAGSIVNLGSPQSYFPFAMRYLVNQ